MHRHAGGGVEEIGGSRHREQTTGEASADELPPLRAAAADRGNPDTRDPRPRRVERVTGRMSDRSKRKGPGGGPAIPRRIAFINEKGGSGKTTLVANVAAHLAAARGLRVLVIDMDPQGQLGKVLGIEIRRPRRTAVELLVDSLLGEAPRAASEATAERSLPATPTRIPRLDIIVGNKALALFPAWTGTQAARDATDRLATALGASPELDAYDFVLFDAPPSFGPLTLNVLRACDEVVVPCPLTYLALDGCAELMRTLEMVRSRYGHTGLRLTMVIPTFYRRTRLAHECLERLRARFPNEIAQSVVGYHVKIDEAQSRGLSIFEYAPRDRGAAAMAALADELLARDARTVDESGDGGTEGDRPSSVAEEELA